MSRSRIQHRDIVTVMLVYAAFAALWILLSDRALDMLFSNARTLVMVSMLKGWFFVAVTSLLLYALLRRLLGPAEKVGAGDTALAAAAAADGTPQLAEPSPKKQALPFILLGIGIIGLTIGSSTYLWQQQREKEVAQLDAIVELKSRQIADWLHGRENDAAFFQTSANYAEQYHLWRFKGDKVAGIRLFERLDQMRANREFVAITLLAPDGEPLWQTDATRVEIGPEIRALAQQASQAGKPYRISPYRLASGPLRFDIITPLTATTDPAPVLVLHADLSASLLSLIQFWPGQSMSAETELFRREGDEVLFLNELRHRTDNAKLLRLPITGSDVLAAQVARAGVQAGEALSGTDYRGVPVVGVARAVPGSDWLLIAKMDSSELYGEAVHSVLWIVMAGLLGLFAAGTGFRVVRQREQQAVAAQLHGLEEDKHKATRLLASIAESSDDAIFAKDLNGRYTVFSRAAEAMTGVAPEFALGKDDTAIFPPELAEAIQAQDRKVFASGTLQRLQESVGDLSLEVTKGPLRNTDGEMIGLFGIARDVTERQRAEASLQASEERLRLLIDHAPVALTMFDRNMRYLAVSRRWLQDYRLDDRDVIGHSHYEVFPEIDASLRAIHKRGLAGETISSDEDRFERADGSVQWLRWEMRPWYQTGGDIGGIVIFSEDITERKVAESALRASEHRFHDIVEASADWVWEVDATGRYTYASESVEQLLGYRSSEVIGKTAFDLMPPDEAERVRAEFLAFAARKEPFRDLDNINLHRDGSLRHLSTNGTPILGPEGELLGYRGVDRDVTEKKQAEMELAALADNLTATLNAIPDLLFEVDADGRYLAIRATRHELLAVPMAELHGRTVSEVLPPDAARTVMAALAAAASSGMDFGRTIALPLETGERHFELSVARKPQVAGQKERFIVLSRDITDRQAAVDRLRERNEELERFNRAAVDRELTVITMKRQINTMARELGREAPYPLDFLNGTAGKDIP